MTYFSYVFKYFHRFIDIISVRCQTRLRLKKLVHCEEYIPVKDHWYLSFYIKTHHSPDVRKG